MFTKIRSFLTRPVIIPSAVVTAVLLGVQYLGVFQQQEVQIFDWMMQIRSNSNPDSRLLIVGLTEDDIQRWKHPLPDQLFVKVFNKLEQHRPRAIGFDFYRDQASSNDQQGHAKLLQHLQNSDIIIPICNHVDANKSTSNSEVAPPEGLESTQLGFSNLILDGDGVIRRNLLVQDVNPSSKCIAPYSLGLQLALKYLEVGGIQAQVTSNNELHIRDVIFKRLENYSGGYQNIDAKGGYQILLNYPSKQIAQQVSITDVLEDKVKPDLIEDKIILIGALAPSLNDVVKTPLDTSGQTPGIFVHASSVSQILSAVLNKKPLFRFLPKWGEIIWLWGWSLVGSLIAWKIRRPIGLGVTGSVSGITLVGASFVALTQAIWLPVVSPLLGLVLSVGSVLVSSAYHSKQEQEKILQQVQEQQEAIAQLQALLHQPENASNDSTEIAFPPSAKISLNTVLNNRYKLIKNLGAGNFGATYIAEDIQYPKNPQYVVKQLRPTRQDQKYLELARLLFNREAQFLEILGVHERIPKFIAYFEENQQFFIVQEFIKGNPLEKEISPGKKLSESKVVQILKDVLEVLVFVHSHQIIHRDIKPSNLIRREEDERIVLIDFGAVKQIQPQQSENQTTMIGTKSYAAPEQAAGFPKLNSDIYALGITGIQALTGVNPKNLQRNPDTDELVFQSSLDILPQHWRKIAPTSQELADILDKMVNFDYKKRYQSASEVLKNIENLK
ncbi:MAG: CHASE2 domain-containing protein [Richelia sp. RM1_1_1]|nr:CHASE2 domain-containing protein [Richelia sp. RM1_1_1]